MAFDAVKAVYMQLDSNQKAYCFELVGLDFMIDSNFKPWLIEVNTNPCLEVGGCVLAKIIPSLVDNVFRVALDPIYPPPLQWPK